MEPRVAADVLLISMIIGSLISAILEGPRFSLKDLFFEIATAVLGTALLILCLWQGMTMHIYIGFGTLPTIPLVARAVRAIHGKYLGERKVKLSNARPPEKR